MNTTSDSLYAVLDSLRGDSRKAERAAKKATKALDAAKNGDEGCLPYQAAFDLFTLRQSQYTLLSQACNKIWEAYEAAEKSEA